MSFISEIMSQHLIIGSIFAIIFFLDTFAFFYILRKQYRFATLLFDMLPYYLYLILISTLIGFYSVFSFDISLSTKLFFAAIILVISGILYTKFAEWYKSYHFSRYKVFLEKIQEEESIEIISWEAWKNSPRKDPNKILILIRHDVDIFLSRAKRMFELERSMGIPSCYLFRNNAERYTIDEGMTLINEIKKDPKFEIGFHYETIANADGDLEKATELFGSELKALRKHFDVNYIAAHGDKYNNRRLKDQGYIDLEEFKLISAYDLPNDIYISDAGGLRKYLVSNQNAPFIDNLEVIFSLPKGSLVQILLHSDWWF
jgi:hypothetical protein